MKSILFVCIENSCRSQMAEGFARHLGKGIVVVDSAGSNPASSVDSLAVEAMREVGIDISKRHSKGFHQLTSKNYNYVITLGCKDKCPFLPADKNFDWNICDPKGEDLEIYRIVRNEIQEHVRALISEITMENTKLERARNERHIDEELDKLNTNLLKMATLTEEAIHKSIESLKERNRELAELTIENDKKIDELENIIEEGCIELLALFQPVAKDLRFITTGMRINMELERIGDLTVNICQRVIEIADYPLVKPLVDIPKLAENSKHMVKLAIDSFVRHDQQLAKQVIFSDGESNRLRTSIIEELVHEYMVKDGSICPRAVPLLLIARDLERISDHASSIAEDVIYMIQAKIVKHHPERLA